MQNGRAEMDEKKEGSKILEFMKPNSKVEISKKPGEKGFFGLKNSKAKTSVKKIGRSRNQKGQKSY
jgi:hypothetical protein